MSALELARFTVAPERREEMLEARRPAIEALRREFPGLMGGHLARLDETTWIDALLWRTRGEAESAAERARSLPEAAAYFRTFDAVLAMEHGEVVQSD